MNTTANTTRIRWWIAGLMWLAIAINYIDRTVLSAAAPHLIDELKLDPEMMGFIMAAFFWSYSLLQIPAGWFADRFGQKKGLGLAVAWWSIATSMMGVATGFKSLLALRLALGVGEAAAYPATQGSPHAGFRIKNVPPYPDSSIVRQNLAGRLPCRLSSG